MLIYTCIYFFKCDILTKIWGFSLAQWVKNLAVQETQETQVRAMGWEDPLKEEMANYSSILAWRILWTEEPGYSPWDHKESDMTEHAHTPRSSVRPARFQIFPDVMVLCKLEKNFQT